MPAVVYEPNNTRSAKEFAKVKFKRFKIKTVFALVRENKTWDCVGTYPLLVSVLEATHEMGIAVTRQEITKLLRSDSEFKTIKPTSEIVEAIYTSYRTFCIPSIQARVTSQNAATARLSADSDIFPIQSRNELKNSIETRRV